MTNIECNKFIIIKNQLEFYDVIPVIRTTFVIYISLLSIIADNPQYLIEGLSVTIKQIYCDKLQSVTCWIHCVLTTKR